ncbi:hypothetical protein IJT93_07755 [bacterium]|nr:hypothetical protein [bacterium]
MNKRTNQNIRRQAKLGSVRFNAQDDAYYTYIGGRCLGRAPVQYETAVVITQTRGRIFSIVPCSNLGAALPGGANGG